MVILRIKEKGYMIEIPGVSPFRTPADVNITHISIPLAVSVLNSQGIEKFEIISDTPGKEQVFTEKDFKEPDAITSKMNGRLKKLEGMIKKLLKKEASDLTSNQEQITDKLKKLEVLSTAILESSERMSSHEGDPNIEELDTLDTFIPDIDIKGSKMKGKSGKKVFKKDKEDTDENANLLASLTGGKK